ncbi:MAG: exodeoxyribonuclease VII large subunit [Verrucomicrobiae bacterium]|nr:exodeoxyribonuclease VII large subunit [Verrucomicrobiae bacterium]
MAIQTSKTCLTVSELTRQIRDLLEDRLGSVWVKGEISNFRRQNSGHCYFTLKDVSAQLSAVLFKGIVSTIPFEPKDGQQVALFGEITVYELQGKYQIIVRQMMPQGLGDLQQRFEALKKKLLAEGLFSAERKKLLPRYPSRVAIITSPTGAAIQDMLNILKRRAPQLQLFLYPVRVQGNESAQEISQALQQLSRWHQKKTLSLDAIILARGGGSLEDLWSFNEEIVARAIAACPIPTISGVGHEVDFTIADLVADLRAPTPSAAAELLIQDRQEILKSITKHHFVLQRALQHQLTQLRLHLNRCAKSTVFRDPVRIIALFQQRIDDLAEKLSQAPRLAAQQKRYELQTQISVLEQYSPTRLIPIFFSQLKALAAKLELLNPLHTLERGFALIKTPEGKLVRSSRQLTPEDSFQVQMRDGTIDAKVK